MKRKWWLWLLPASVCLIIVFVVSELIGVSIGSILGWGTFGVLGVLALIVSLAILAGFAFPIACLLKLLVASFISNSKNLSIILGILGFCSILVGYILNATREFWWSIFIVMVGFFIGFLAGEEYQRFSDLRKEEEARQG